MYTLALILSMYAAAVTTYGPRPVPAYRIPTKAGAGRISEFKNSHPELYGITQPPPVGFRMYAEFTPVQGMLVTFDSVYLRDYFVDLIGAATHGTEVYVVVDGQQMASDVDSILATSLTTEEYQHVHYLDISSYPYLDSPIGSIWMVDYGPFFVVNGDGEVAMVDPHYYPERVDDDAIPAKVADQWGMTDYRVDLYLEGGNLLSDGQGTCYTTTMLQQENPSLTATEIEDVLAAYFGCEKVAWLTPLQNEGTGHIDMFFILASPTTVIVGQYTPSQDAANASILDSNAEYLESFTTAAGSPLQVLRIPMPDKGWDSYYQMDVWRTYTNGLRINDIYLMPVYEEDSSHEQEARQILAQALGDVQIVPVKADDIIYWAGAIHCTTRTVPAGDVYVPDSTPEYACDGKFECDCIDECARGAMECDGEGARRICAQTDADACLEWVTIPCPEGTSCSDGVCGSCEDECDYGSVGCADEHTVVRCGEAGDFDACLEDVLFECPSGRVCDDGLCLPAQGCGDVDFEGECQGTVSVWCENGQLQLYDCAQDGLVCGWNESEQYYDCIQGTACEDECVGGEFRCTTDGNAVEACVTDAISGCLHWKTVQQCPDGCRDGSCTAGPNPGGGDDTGTGNGTDDGTEGGGGTDDGGSGSSGGCSCSVGTRMPMPPAFHLLWAVAAVLIVLRRRASR